MGSPSFFDINVLGFVALEGLPFQLESIIVSIFERMDVAPFKAHIIDHTLHYGHFMRS
jgi:hypothetical protein